MLPRRSPASFELPQSQRVFGSGFSLVMARNTRQFSPAGLSHCALLVAVCLLPLKMVQAQADRSADSLPLLDLDRPIRLNFAGDWEKDFNRSDRWEDELNRLLTIRQERAAQQRSGVTVRNLPRASLGNLNLNSLGGRGTDIVNLARLAEYVSRQTILRIEQDRSEVSIERRGEAPLICTVDHGLRETFSSEHGKEFCGWDGQQLVFIINLPDQLEISHRFDVSAAEDELRLVTSISHRGSAPFNLIQAFNRFDAGADDLNCVLTVTRGRVCRQVSPLADE